MVKLYDVRQYDETWCKEALAIFEGEVARGHEDYREGLNALKARIAEIGGKTVQWAV